MSSVGHVADWPAALLLSVCRTRPPSGSGLSARFLRRLIPKVDIHPRRLRGLSLAINPADLPELIVYEEMFVQDLYDLSSLPFEPDVVIDCGGFEGYFTLLARAWFRSAKFVAFEPHPENYAKMCLNFKRNDIDVDARPQAVSNWSGEMRFTGGGLGGHLCSEVDVAVTTQVSVVRLCDVISHLSPKRLLLKLDIEGEEDRVLRDLVSSLPMTCAVFFESHRGNEGFGELEDCLRKASFAVKRCRTHSIFFVDGFALRFQRGCFGSTVVPSKA